MCAKTAERSFLRKYPAATRRRRIEAFSFLSCRFSDLTGTFCPGFFAGSGERGEAEFPLHLTKTQYVYFQACISDLVQSEDVRSMAGFIQHADISTLEHCFSVAYVSFWVCESFHLSFDRKSLIRGAFLHDFFLYDWHTGAGGRKGLHGFTHPKTALHNAESRFPLTDRERDIIVKHMWPLTPAFPRYRESYLVGAADKYCSLVETLLRHPAVKLSSALFSRRQPLKHA